MDVMKKPGIDTIQDAINQAQNYCKYCDLDETCTKRYTYLRFMITDLTDCDIENDEYDYTKPFVDFYCVRADIRNFHKKWPHKKESGENGDRCESCRKCD